MICINNEVDICKNCPRHSSVSWTVFCVIIYSKIDTVYPNKIDALLMMFDMEDMENTPQNPTI